MIPHQAEGEPAAPITRAPVHQSLRGRADIRRTDSFRRRSIGCVVKDGEAPSPARDIAVESLPQRELPAVERRRATVEFLHHLVIHRDQRTVPVFFEGRTCFRRSYDMPDLVYEVADILAKESEGERTAGARVILDIEIVVSPEPGPER